MIMRCLPLLLLLASALLARAADAVPGDANGDGVLNVADHAFVQAIVNRRLAATAAADVDGDGQVTTTEALDWARYTLQATQRRMTQTPELWGSGADLVLAHPSGSPPERAALLYELARHHQQRRSSEIDQAREDLEGQAERAWRDVVREGGAPEAVSKWLDGYQGAKVEVHGQRRWAVITELGAARQAAGMTSDLNATAQADPQATASHDQISSEMRHLAKRNAWKGVERAFLDLEALSNQGEHPSIEDLDLAAQAARALGKADAVHQRLTAMAALDPAIPGVLQWLNEIEASYGRVNMRDRAGTGATLTPARMPMAPDQRAAIQAAAEELEAEGRFQGRLPWGAYSFGERMFVVIPGDREIEITLSRTR